MSQEYHPYQKEEKRFSYFCVCVCARNLSVARQSIMSPREHWDTVCQTLGIPIPVSTIWFEKLATNYNQSNRYYHNTNILKCKLDALKDHGYQPIQSHLIFAIFFQYYQFDVKRNCCTENCEAFRSFCRDAALDDVSKYLQFS